jgi:hypothetical protein
MDYNQPGVARVVLELEPINDQRPGALFGAII